MYIEIRQTYSFSLIRLAIHSCRPAAPLAPNMPTHHPHPAARPSPPPFGNPLGNSLAHANRNTPLAPHPIHTQRHLPAPHTRRKIKPIAHRPPHRPRRPRIRPSRVVQPKPGAAWCLCEEGARVDGVHVGDRGTAVRQLGGEEGEERVAGMGEGLRGVGQDVDGREEGAWQGGLRWADGGGLVWLLVAVVVGRWGDGYGGAVLLVVARQVEADMSGVCFCGGAVVLGWHLVAVGTAWRGVLLEAVRSMVRPGSYRAEKGHGSVELR